MVPPLGLAELVVWGSLERQWAKQSGCRPPAGAQAEGYAAVLELVGVLRPGLRTSLWARAYTLQARRPPSPDSLPTAGAAPMAAAAAAAMAAAAAAVTVVVAHRVTAVATAWVAAAAAAAGAGAQAGPGLAAAAAVPAEAALAAACPALPRGEWAGLERPS